MKQWDAVYPTIYNVVVDTVVRAVMLEVCGLQEAHNGFGWVVGEHNIVFYTENICISGSNRIWVHTTLIEMVRMFKKVGLLTNLRNNKAMVCIMDFIWG